MILTSLADFDSSLIFHAQSMLDRSRGTYVRLVSIQIWLAIIGLHLQNPPFVLV